GSQEAKPQLAPNAPHDRPLETAQRCVWNAMERAMQPYIALARASWPKARQRYLAGLPPRHSFFVTALLVDESDRREQVFIAVERIHDGRITGKIWNDVDIVPYMPIGPNADWYAPCVSDRCRAQASDVVLAGIPDDGASEGSRRRGDSRSGVSSGDELFVGPKTGRAEYRNGGVSA